MDSRDQRATVQGSSTILAAWQYAGGPMGLTVAASGALNLALHISA